jgi:hypothetical protein
MHQPEFKIATPVVPVGTESSQVVIWSKAGCGAGTSKDPIKCNSRRLNINDVIKVRISFYSVAGIVAVESYRLEEWYARSVGLIRCIEYLTPFTGPSTIFKYNPLHDILKKASAKKPRLAGRGL